MNAEQPGKDAMKADTIAKRARGSETKRWLGKVRSALWPPVEESFDATQPIAESVGKSGERFRFRVACDMASRERVFRFAHEIYSGVSLAQDDDGMVVSPHDAGPETFTLLAESEDGTILGTVSLVFDSERGLPCDEIYWQETGALRSQGRAMAEVTRLALRKDPDASREILLRLFNLIYVYATRVRGYTDFVIEVHPRHVKYYERALGFRTEGGEQKCPRVGGAPAVLARLDLALPKREVRRIGGLGDAVKERTLYRHFWYTDREPGLARAMAAAWRPMPEHEARYFGIAPTSEKEGVLAS